MNVGDEFKRYVDGVIRQLEEQIAREEAAMTEEEKAAEEVRQKEFSEKMIKIIKENHL